MKSVLFFAILASSLLSQAYTLQPVKKVGSAQRPVVFVSQNVRSAGKNHIGPVAQTRMITQWGTRVFQVGTAYYQCKPQNKTCQFIQFDAKAAYEKCVIKKNQARCYGKINGTSGPGSASSSGSTWYDNADFPQRPGNANDIEEYPGRGEPGPDVWNDGAGF